MSYLSVSVPFYSFSSTVLIFGACMEEIILAVLTDPIIVWVGIVMGLADRFLTHTANLEEPGLSSVWVEVVLAWSE